MAKKKKVQKPSLVNIFAVLLAVIAIALFALLPMVKATIGEEGNQIVTIYKGFGMIFGGTVNSDISTTTTIFGNTNTVKTTLEIDNLSFNTMAFISLCVVTIGIIATLATTFSKNQKSNKIFTTVSGALLVIGGILMFTIKAPTLEILSLSKVSEYCSLGLGTILAGILSIFAGGLVVVYPIIKK